MPKLQHLTNQFNRVKHKVLAATPQNIKRAKPIPQLFKCLFSQRWPQR